MRWYWWGWWNWRRRRRGVRSGRVAAGREEWESTTTHMGWNGWDTHAQAQGDLQTSVKQNKKQTDKWKAIGFAGKFLCFFIEVVR